MNMGKACKRSPRIEINREQDAILHKWSIACAETHNCSKCADFITCQSLADFLADHTDVSTNNLKEVKGNIGHFARAVHA